MCSMASTGSSMPTMRPTSRAHSPPQLTTCSAPDGALLGDDIKAAVAARLSATTRLPQKISAPAEARRFGIGMGGALGIEVAVGASSIAPTK